MKKILLTLFSAAALFNIANAQVSIYSFAQTAGTYTPITTGTSVATGIQDDSVISAKPIGFTFNYNGTNYTQFGLNINGWISLGTTTPSSSYVPVSGGTTNNIISALGRDLKLGYTAPGSTTSGSNTITMAAGATTGFYPSDVLLTATNFPAGTVVTAVGATTLTVSNPATATGSTGTYTVAGNIQYLTSGTAPNRTCVIQWTRARRYSSSAIDQKDLFNFQIRLQETTNVISIVYGLFQTNTTSSVYQIGLRGASATDFNNRKTTTNWASTTAGTVNTDTVSLSTTVKPTSGQTYAWTPAPSCTGTPTAGTAAASASAVCSGVSFTLSLTGYTTGVSNIAIQWQSSPASGGTYTSISGATSATYSATQTATTYYKALVSCNGGTGVASNIVAVTMSAASGCYCTPVHSSACSTTNHIDSVVIVGTTLSNLNTNCAGTSGPSYTAYPSTGSTTATLNAASAYTFKIGTNASNIISVWIDYNQNGVYEASEWTQVATNSVANVTNTVSVTIPSSATAGLTGMRIRSRSTGNPNGSGDACTDFGSGETEDYKVTIVAASPCSGAPTAGTASGPSGVCSGIAFNLVLTGYTTGVSGITIQWQSSSALGGTYTNISGATTPTYSATQTATTYYKALVTCSGGAPTASNIVTVTQNAASACYCTPPSTSCTLNDVITNVTISTINNTTTCGTAGYASFTTPTATLNQAQSYPVSVTVGTGGTEHVAIWIDYNQNGIFETSEFNSVGSGNGTAVTSSILIPPNATVGATRMRVRLRYSVALTGADACIAYTYGETEDYAITIGAGTACTGTPTAGTASVSSDSVCLQENYTLMLTGYTPGVAGLTFQWQSSSTLGGTYTDITGATSVSYTTTQTATTYYKVSVKCNGGTAVYSNVVTVILNPLLTCYCKPVHSTACSLTNNIDSVRIVGTTLANLHTGCTSTTAMAYTSYPATGTTTASLTAGSTYVLKVTTTAVNIISVWIDYNRNGTYDTTEWYQVSASSLANAVNSLSFTVPSTTTAGIIGMRIRSRSVGSANGNVDACTNFGSGETEDYLVTIISTVGIEENEVLNSVLVYPNPTAGLFNVVINNANFNQVTISVIDIQGKEVYNVSEKNNSATYSKQINLEGLSKGLYYIKLNTENGVKVQKLIIQ
ncbi:MAG: GEVED domain-containing protein [Bacteroidota bacterium]